MTYKLFLPAQINAQTQSALGCLYIQFEQPRSVFLVHYITTRGHLIHQACSAVFDKLP